MRHLDLIGTGHVFQIQEAIHEAIVALRPDVVFVELDRARLQALLHKEKTGESPTKGGGYVHKKLAAFQESVADMYGSQVGGEMLAAVRAAQRINARVALIDPPADQTIKRAMKELTWKEKGRAIGDVVKATWSSTFQRKDEERQASMEDEIRRYQEDPTAALAQLEERYPTVYRIVIADRDKKMADAIQRLLEPDQRGVAVVGDGHVEGMNRLLTDMEITMYRLPDVREGRLPRSTPMATGTAEDVHFGFSVDV